MNRNDWEARVKASDLNPTARLVALVLGGFGNWTVDKTVEPGESRVAKEAGLDPSTVATYVDAFVEQGWLKPIGKGRYNTTIYELCESDSPATGVLAKTKRKSNPKSKQNLRKGTPVVPERTGNIKVVGGGLVPGTTEFSSRKEPELVPERIGGSSRYHRDEPKEPREENLEEPRQTTVHGPVVETVREEDSPSFPNYYTYKDSQPSPNSNMAEPVYFIDLSGVTKTVQGADTPAVEGVLRTRRILTPGEKDHVASIMRVYKRVYKVTEQQAAEAMELIETTAGPQDISEAATEALVAIGAVDRDEVEVW